MMGVFVNDNEFNRPLVKSLDESIYPKPYISRGELRAFSSDL